MGGYGSGRHGQAGRLDSGLRLDINKLVRDKLVGLNKRHTGNLTWNIVGTGEPVASAGYETNTLNPDDMWLRLHYTLTPCFGGEPEKKDYKIRLVTTQPKYGGKRVWFICPITHRRTSVLYSSGGSRFFASRYAYRSGYRSQSKGHIDRAIDRMWNLKGKLGGENFFIRPKGMHTRTHERMMKKIWAAEEVCDGYLAAFVREKLGSLEAATI